MFLAITNKETIVNAEGLVNAKNENDEYIDKNNKRWHLDIIGAEQFYKENIFGEGVKIAVIENHAELHADFLNKDINYISCYEEGYEFKSSSYCEPSFSRIDDHATNSVGVILSDEIGVAPKATVYSVSPHDLDENFDPEDDIQRAFNWAIDNDMDIISISSTFAYTGNNEEERKVYENFKKDIDSLIEKAYENDIIVVASSGNGDGVGVVYPARHEKVVAVGSINVKDQKIVRVAGLPDGEGSTYGEGLSFVAPGLDVSTTVGRFEYEEKGGSSIATPIVAGYLALLKDYYNKKGIVKTNYDILEIAKKNAIPIMDFEEKKEEYEESFLEGDYYNTGYGYGMIHGIPKEGTVEVDTKKTFYKYPSEQAESMGKISDIVLDESVKIPYYKKWNNWYKVNNGKGEKVWINTEESVGSEQEPIVQTPSITYPYDSIATYMNRDGTYSDYIKGGTWVHEAAFKDFSYEELDNNYTHHPKEEVYKYYRMMATGEFYDSQELYEERLTYHQKLCEIEEEMMGEYYYGCNAEYEAENPRSSGEVTPDRVDYRNIYNLVLENENGETYFIPVISSATFAFDIEKQFFGPKTNDYVHSDGRISRYIDVKAILPEHGFEIFDFRGLFYSWASLGVGTFDYNQLGKTSILPVLEERLGEEKLKLVDVIYEQPKEKEGVIETPEEPTNEIPEEPIIETPKEPTWYENANEIIAYTDENGEDVSYIKMWRKETEDVTVNYDILKANYVYYPNKDLYNTLKTRYKDYNQYNLVLENKNGEKYFAPIWTTALLNFDLENQEIRAKTSDYTHPQGHHSQYLSINGARRSNVYSYTMSVGSGNYNQFELLSFLTNELGDTNLKLVDVVIDDSTDWFK